MKKITLITILLGMTLSGLMVWKANTSAVYMLNEGAESIPLFEKASTRSKKVAWLRSGKKVRVEYVGQQKKEWLYTKYKNKMVTTHKSFVEQFVLVNEYFLKVSYLRKGSRLLLFFSLALFLYYFVIKDSIKKLHVGINTRNKRKQIPSSYTEHQMKTMAEDFYRQGQESVKHQYEQSTVERYKRSEEEKEALLEEQKEKLYQEFNATLVQRNAAHQVTVAEMHSLHNELRTLYEKAQQVADSVGIGDFEDEAIETRLKGYLFELFIAEMLTHRLGFKLLEWTSDKGIEKGIFTKANGNPDLVFENKEGCQFAVECKYKSNWYPILKYKMGDSVVWATPKNARNYVSFSKERNNMPVWVAIGVGGTATAPGFLTIDLLKNLFKKSRKDVFEDKPWCCPKQVLRAFNVPGDLVPEYFVKAKKS